MIIFNASPYPFMPPSLIAIIKYKAKPHIPANTPPTAAPILASVSGHLEHLPDKSAPCE